MVERSPGALAITIFFHQHNNMGAVKGKKGKRWNFGQIRQNDTTPTKQKPTAVSDILLSSISTFICGGLMNQGIVFFLVVSWQSV